MQNESSLGTPVRTFNLPHLCRYFSDRSPQAMLAVEGTTCVVRHVNPAFLGMAGAKRSDLIGVPFAEAVPEGVANRCMALLDRVYRTGTPECLAEQRHGENPRVYWSYVVWPILGGDDRPAGVMIQVTDSTETALFREQAVAMNEKLLVSSLRQQELAETSHGLAQESRALATQLEAAVKEKEYFIAVLSHELRTPLAPLLLAASALQQDQRLEPDTREIMRMFHRNITQEVRLVDDLLDMTRMERRKLRLDCRPIDLRSVLEPAVDASRAELEAAGLSLEVDVRGPQFVNADITRLQQVFSNLLRNAVKFTPSGGRIRVLSRREGDWCVVEVIDNGAGIAAEFLPRVFGAFEQDRNPPLRVGSGLGLGLAICKTIMDLHGGIILARSEGKGRGATFEVRLPAMKGVRSAPVEKEADSDALRRVKPLRILLVEDHADTAHIMQRLLSADGHTVEWAGNISAGRKLAADDKFDLLLSDVGLPDGTGMDLMRALRKDGLTLPGIVTSGYGQDDDVVRSQEAGFAAHLIKPLSLQALRDAIVAVVP